MKKLFFCIIFLSASLLSFTEEMQGTTSDINKGVAAGLKGNSSGKRGFSFFLTYPILYSQEDNKSFNAGFGSGFNIDFGGSIPVINLMGIEFSMGYSFINNNEDMHYIHYGPSLYLRSNFEALANIGFRTGLGNGWIISAHEDQESGNNPRKNGIYSSLSPFIELNTNKLFYLHAGYELREQVLNSTGDGDDRGNTRIHLDIVYLRAGLRF